VQINITLNGDESDKELNALAALIASLGGRAPQTTVENVLRIEKTEQDEGGALKVRNPGDDEGEPRNTDTSELDAEIIDAAVQAGAPAFDSAGIPWDARIHSESRATIADGTWRKRRNVPQDVYDSVLAELTASGGAVPPPPSTTTSDTPEPPAPAPVVTEPAAVVAAPVTDVPPPPPVAGAKAIDDMTWPEFVQHVQNKDVPETAKVYAALNTVSETFDVKRFIDMKDKKSSWPMFYDMVG